MGNADRHPDDSVSALCARFRVRKLDMFGSAARGTDFGPDSDVDVLVTYEPDHSPPSLEDFLALREALSAVFGRTVDLVMEGAVRNPFVRDSIQRSRQSLYGA